MNTLMIVVRDALVNKNLSYADYWHQERFIFCFVLLEVVYASNSLYLEINTVIAGITYLSGENFSRI